MADPITILSRVTLFAHLPQGELQRLAQEMRPVAVPAGTTVFREGEEGDFFYVIVDGQFDVFKAVGTGDERLIATQGSGSFVGEMSLLNPDHLRTATVRSRGEVRALELTRDGFNALIHRQPMLAYDMVRIMSERLTDAHNRALRDMHATNLQLAQALEELRAAQSQLVEKERLERELELAAQIQMSLLPTKMPCLVGFDFGARLVPAHMVGGDLYDFISLAPHKVGIAIGDVTDKGVPAAIFMAQAQALLHAEASRGATPSQALQAANRQLRARNADGMFVTAVYGVLDGDTDEFTFARAGHDMPLLFDAAGERIPLTRKRAAPLGLWDDVLLDEQVVKIPPNGSLYLYTDGVCDVKNRAGESFGLERLRAALVECTGLPAGAACDQVMQHVLDYCRDVPHADDITMVVVHAGNR